MLEVLLGSILLAGGLSSQRGYQREIDREHALRRLFPPDQPPSMPGTTFDPEVPYSISGVIFDAAFGLGATSNNQNVNYMGFMVWMTPNEFMALNPPRNPDKGNWVENQVRSGAPIAAPFLLGHPLEEDEATLLSERDLWDHEKGKPLPVIERPIRIQITGHEGRTRFAALQSLGLGNTKFPIAVILSYIRSRFLLPEHLLGGTLIPDRRCQEFPDHQCESHVIKQITLDKKNYSVAGI